MCLAHAQTCRLLIGRLPVAEIMNRRLGGCAFLPNVHLNDERCNMIACDTEGTGFFPQRDLRWIRLSI